MIFEVVTLLVDGLLYTGWKSMSVKGDADSHEISFQVTASDESPDLMSNAFVFEPGKQVVLLSNGEPLVTGNIDKLDINLKRTAHPLKISGRSGRDATDCSVKHKTKEWKQKKPDAIVNDMGNNVKFYDDEGLKNADIRTPTGMKVWEAADKLVKEQGAFLTGQRDGRVRMGRHGKQSHAGGIIEGINMHDGGAVFSDNKRHETIEAHGQKSTGTKDTDRKHKGEAKDSGAVKGRYLAIPPNKSTTKGGAQKTAEQAQRERQGQSVTAKMVTVGFRDEGGTLWTPGWLVYNVSVALNLNQDLAIKSYEFKQDRSGSFASLDLVDPAALGGKGGGSKKGGKNRSAGAWTAGTESFT